ncbi:TetR/AcrR family transcriptional regulator [Bradyrhizobium tropiciagri]|uniref:TetR/AcrR family transcriptional regulator n=1 Tax=Bradyrhizobium tropiciagri TaxID=312253 RepID=UPI001BA712F4|nr:TetR/AcrR family transcriptional regulator [Bradyrhizobium tropiciagri]MBR0873150.1 TetR/AcrR family transcriptional regulator [Bradyrhizobium tropiciagri]
MPPRSYVSPTRSAAAAETRERVLEAAARTLREGESIARFSLDTVAKAAGVTRLTVYNQFGSRRGLLEAVFDDIARQGGLHKLIEAMTMADPRAALDRMVEIFCGFWSRDPAVARLNDAMATDPEFAEAVRERNERRRKGLTALVDRIAGKTASQQARKDAVDLIFALTSYPTFASLSAGRSREEVSRLLQAACHAALAPLADPSSS